MTVVRRFLALLLSLASLASSLVLLIGFPAVRTPLVVLHIVIAAAALATLLVVTWDALADPADPPPSSDRLD